MNYAILKIACVYAFKRGKKICPIKSILINLINKNRNCKEVTKRKMEQIS